MKYDHVIIEAKWQKIWLEKQINTLDIQVVSKPFYNLMMFPYPSAEGLHVGNMYAFTGTDIYGRYKRMQGYDVFEPIGLDGFGIHSENYALKVGRHPIEQAKHSEENFYRQLHSIGAMFDWTRTVETYDPSYYRWTQWLFVQMFKRGLAYRAKAEVNWCPSCKTVLADEQVIEQKCERCGNLVEKKALEQWFFRITAYAGKLLENISSLNWTEKVLIAQRNWIGKKAGVVIHHPVENLDIQLDTFSAYPGWLWADTFIVIAPDHPIVEQLIVGMNQEKEVSDFIVQWRQNNKDVKKKTDEKRGIFTGRYAIDPFNKGARMPIWIANFALMGFGTGIIRCSSHDPRDFEFANKYKIPLKEVVKRVISTEPVNAHNNEGVLQQSGPFSDKKLSARLINEIIDWIVQEKIGRRETTYHLRDWLISRQRYWGPPIPMIHCNLCEKNGKGERDDMPGWYTVSEKDLPVELPNIKDYKPGDDGVAPLAKHKEFYHVVCPKCGETARRETDVSDTFLDSSWYFLRYPSTNMHDAPFDKNITKKWLPVSLYTGGAEHSVLHLMYSRFVTMALKDWGYLDFEEPFPNFYAHGLVIKDGAKMSKSKGNVVNPDEYIKLYGTDALRLYLMFMGPFSEGGDFRDSAMEGMSRWIHRVWRLGVESLKSKVESRNIILEKALHKTIKKVGEDIEKRHYNTAIASMMEFTNLVAEKNSSLSLKALQTFLLILAPFAPHITEEIWSRLDGVFSIHQQPWPSYDEQYLVEDTVTIIVQVNGKLRDSMRIDAKSAGRQEKVEATARSSEKVKKFLSERIPTHIVFIPKKLINFVV